MATGGRVVHHLAHQLPDRRNTVVLVGYQAEGTRGRSLAEGARQVKIHGRYVPVRAEIVDLADFSVHADAREIIDWLGRAPRPPGRSTSCTASRAPPRGSPAASPPSTAGRPSCRPAASACSSTER